MSKIKLCFLSATCLLLFQGSMVKAQSGLLPSSLPTDVAVPTTLKDYNNLVPKDTYALPWEPIKESNIVWQKRVWRDIDIQQPGNEAFAYNDGLTKVMLTGFFEGKYKVYSGGDDRFTTQLNKGDVMALFTQGIKNDPSVFTPAKVARYRIKEDWLYLKQEHRMVVRILGIAPLVQVAQPDGTIADQPAFWVYHPEMRSFLANQKIVTAEDTEQQNWDQLFEGRKFASTITKVSGRPEPHMPPTE